MKPTKHIAALVALLLTTTVAVAQTNPCPGWKNPTNFSATFTNAYGGTSNCWSGKVGTPVAYPGQAPNVMTSTTGISLNSTVYSGNNLTTATTPADSWSSSNLPTPGRQFYINTTNGNDANVGSGLKYIPSATFNFAGIPGLIEPTNITSTVRIGDGYGAGQGQSIGNAAALYYEILPSVDNAILVLYYAIVVEAPGHGVNTDPAMIIRVMEKTDPENPNSSWSQVSDNKAYYITSTPANCSYCSDGGAGNIVIGQGGWHEAGAFYYKSWEKVVINLSDRIGFPTRIEILVRDCAYTAHCAYAYIAGECQSAKINVAGCPPGMSTEVATLGVPRGMKNYEWSVSNYGVSDPVTNIEAGEMNDYFTFRTLQTGTDADSGYLYHAQADDFRVVYHPHGPGTQDETNDSIGLWQTFRCNVTSAIDPAKPFTSSIYVNVKNSKPSVHIDTLYSCDGYITLKNRSEIPGESLDSINFNTSTFSFYNNPVGGGEPLQTSNGDSTTYFFSDDQIGTQMSVLVHTQHKINNNCYTDALYPIRPLKRPATGFTLLPDSVLCDGQTTTLTDTTPGSIYRQWKLITPTSTAAVPEYDYVTGTGATENKTLPNHSFNHTSPVELTVRNGSFCFDTLTHDTLWCEATARHNVIVFDNPKLKVTGDTIVCVGSKTALKVEVEGMEGCTFRWSRTNGVVDGSLPAGDSLIVEPYADVATYYVEVTSPDGCVAWGSVKTYLVRPRLTMIPEDGRVCPGGEVILTGHDAAFYTWTSTPSDTTLLDTANVVHVFPTQNTIYTMVGHGSDSCDATPIDAKVTILPPPTPKVSLTPPYVDVDDPTVILHDVSPTATSSSWTFDNGETAEGNKVSHTFDGIMNREEVGVELTTRNVINCATVYPFKIPVKLFTAWFPTAFTPNSDDDNATFKLYSVNSYEYFHIYIYDRQGRLMYESDDPEFEWDGTHDGNACRQGAYVYICNYRKPGTPTLSTLKGTITLIR